MPKLRATIRHLATDALKHLVDRFRAPSSPYAADAAVAMAVDEETAAVSVDTNLVRRRDGSMEIRLLVTGPHVALTKKEDVDAITTFVTHLLAARIQQRPSAS